MLSKNGCVGGLRGSLKRGRGRTSPLPRTLSLESPKRLRFAMSEELASRDLAQVTIQDGSPPPPSSPVSDDCTVRRVSHEVKRNSCPCIKEHREQSRGNRTQALLAPPGDDSPLLSNLEFAVSPVSSLAGSGDDEALAASRRTSFSEVGGSRPSSFVESSVDPSLPTYSEAQQSSVTRDVAQRSTTSPQLHQAVAHKNNSDLDLRLAVPSGVSRPSSAGGGGAPAAAAGVKGRYSLCGSGNTRWRSHSLASQGSRRGSAADDPLAAAGGDGAERKAAHLRFCSKQDVCSSSTDCEESAPLLASVVNYRVINEVHKLPERETPV